MAQRDAGQLSGTNQKFGNPEEVVPMTNSSGYIDKKGAVYGEAAKLNQMPPGEDIENQQMADIRSMPMKTIVSGDY